MIGLLVALGLLLAPPVTPKRAVIVSIDGLRADAVAHAPTLHRLLREGAGTLDARTDPDRTYTLPNHLCMVTGRTVEGPQGHHYVVNSTGGPTVHETAGRYVASVFDVVHDHGGSVLVLVAKSKLGQFGEWWGPYRGAPDGVPPDHGRGKVDRVFVESDDAVADRATEILASEPPTLMFVHFAAPDRAGHGSGWTVAEKSAYLDAVGRTEANLAKIVGAIAPSTLLLITTDHGGVGFGHGNARDPRIHTIPFVAWGAGVSPGADLYALNPQRRPKFSPIRNCAVGNTALAALGLPPIPGSTVSAVNLVAPDAP